MSPNSSIVALPPSHWPINAYWNETPDRISQHWYITFCLLMSAVQDYLTGMVLKEQNNLNWVVTCRYYSMVHIGRLLAFITVGDFPRKHAVLQKLFKKCYISEEHSERVLFDSLNSFHRLCPKGFTANAGDYLSESIKYSLDLDGINKFACRLCEFGKIRNDANYEALIIAHEYHHSRVTGLFDRMEKASRLSAQDSIELAMVAYNIYLRNHPIFASERESHFLVSNEYISGRLDFGIRKKLAGYDIAKNELARIKGELTIPVSGELRQSNSVNDIELRIEMSQFTGKNSLFDSLDRKVTELELAVGDRRNTVG